MRVIKSVQSKKAIKPELIVALHASDSRSNQYPTAEVLLAERESLLKQLKEAQSIITRKKKDIDVMRVKFASIEKDVITLVEKVSTKDQEICEITLKDIGRCMKNRLTNLVNKLVNKFASVLILRLNKSYLSFLFILTL